MQRLLDLNKLLLRRSATAVESGGSSYDAFLRPLSRSLESASSSLVLRESFQQRSAGNSDFISGFCNWFFVRQILGRRTFVSTAGITSHLAVRAQSLKFSFLQKKGFGAWQPYGFRRSYCDMKKTSSDQDKFYMENLKNNEPSCNDDLIVSLVTNIMPPESNSDIGNKKNKLKESIGGISILENNIINVVASKPSFILHTNLKGESSLGEKHSNNLNFNCTFEDDPHLKETKNNIMELGLISPEKLLTCAPRKKLLILNLSGFLLHYKAKKRISGKAVFKRPFCDDFLKFCFEKFDIGIWSSRKRCNNESVIDDLLGEFKHKLLFFWDQSHCTDTGFKTLKNRHQPLFLKELKKLWNKEEAGLPWKDGEFCASNTLLLDDSPYKALLNPPHTAIFPHRYHYNDLGDNSLGPGGDIRVYLEKLALINDVQHYVKDHPFGQSAIKTSTRHWNFYSKIISIHATPQA